LVLELAELGTLYSRIEAGRIPEREGAVLFRQVACAVAHMHARGVLHRDIKPENVFLARCAGEAGQQLQQTCVKLGDLGWAIVKRCTSKRTTLCGTMEYLPPEVCRGAAAACMGPGGSGGLVGGVSLSEEYDESFDLYTLGVLLYEMLVGHSPFAGPSFAATAGAMTEAALMGRIVKGSFAIPHSISRDAQVLIRELMSVEPSSRPSAAQVLQSAWLLRLAGPTQPEEFDY
jgi:serine/threonine protein kinase